MMITQKKGSRILLAAFLIGTFAVPPADAAKTRNPPVRPNCALTTSPGCRSSRSPRGTHRGQSLVADRCQRSLRRLQGAQAQRHGRHSGCGADDGGAKRRRQQLARLQTTSAITGLAGDLKTTGLNPLFQCQFQHHAEGFGCDRFEHHVSNQPHGAGDRGAAQRQPGGGSAAQDLHEQPA